MQRPAWNGIRTARCGSFDAETRVLTGDAPQPLQGYTHSVRPRGRFGDEETSAK